ncbi:glycoside hydrolase family 6 protein [Bipolaris maydis ATCC 48331]|uniref:Glucanase n=2 Tax=Cochliobolus heterostrophus TaxID=5016 RepID=M2UXM3_COCH5|nr:glycoside hydrolase family 6 protein [Bipolaris maydis ATCC 48331]EMD92578.1 glycoside hydrolase family 6 protein [Bipolaris maydis C5]KAJ5022389.1 glycoside hydrolase [Bipolaris maydis]ENI08274.1 glycoside hydrolase family 6 protein [Bipolaris maydis ATCC 48331]KAJ5061088.1 1, 4-beta cellobiohydrolase [Bipolaris maydis]KAJ6198221.1 1, 4-beta cellobiohydrolase [Bipolaris maydis]
MKGLLSATVASAISGALAFPSPVERRQSAVCSSPVTLSGNPFANRTLAVNSFYASEVKAAVTKITDSSLAAKAAKVADIGSFFWIDTRDKIKMLDDIIKDTPCNQIRGLIIYDLPGRDCAAKASNGELAVGEIDIYKSQYIDPIVAIIKKYSNIAFALIIEPDSLPNLVTNINLATCQASASGYREGVAYALKQLNLPNVNMYIDAGHGGWLGWDANLKPGAQELATVYKNAGSPKAVRGISTNVAGWNSLDQVPGEFANSPDGQYNKAQNEQKYVALISPELVAAGMPGQAIVDTGRNGVTGLRKEWGDWCNVIGAGFGRRPTTDTGSPLIDACVWGKPGGESDGTSDSSAKRYDSFCGKDDAFKPSPEAGAWNQAYFEALVKNANPPL